MLVQLPGGERQAPRFVRLFPGARFVHSRVSARRQMERGMRPADPSLQGDVKIYVRDRPARGLRRVLELRLCEDFGVEPNHRSR